MGQPRNQKGNQKIHWDKWKWIHSSPKSLRCIKSCSKKKDFTNISLSQESRKVANKQSNLTPLKDLEKEEQILEPVEGRGW